MICSTSEVFKEDRRAGGRRQKGRRQEGRRQEGLQSCWLVLSPVRSSPGQPAIFVMRSVVSGRLTGGINQTPLLSLHNLTGAGRLVVPTPSHVWITIRESGLDQGQGRNITDIILMSPYQWLRHTIINLHWCHLLSWRDGVAYLWLVYQCTSDHQEKTVDWEKKRYNLLCRTDWNRYWKLIFS